MTPPFSRALMTIWLVAGLGVLATRADAQDQDGGDPKPDDSPAAAVPAPPHVPGHARPAAAKAVPASKPPKGTAAQVTSKPEAPAPHAGESVVRLVPFASSPFPYEGKIPEQNIPFLDVDQGGRRGHTSPRGGIYFEDKTYSDRHVLLAVPHGFSLERPALIVLYLHGNQARLDRDVRDRQHVPQQVAASGLNAVLVAPQFAVDALDSSAGNFWREGFLGQFLDEASDRLAKQIGDPGAREAFDKLPVVIVAYSGGYLPTAFGLQWGGAAKRIKGVILLDGLYAEEPKIAEWIMRRGEAFFFSAFSASTKAPNLRLESLVAGRGVRPSTGLPRELMAGSVSFLPVNGAVTHNDFISHAWTANPMRDILSRIPGYPRTDGRTVPAATAEH